MGKRVKVFLMVLVLVCVSNQILAGCQLFAAHASGQPEYYGFITNVQGTVHIRHSDGSEVAITANDFATKYGGLIPLLPGDVVTTKAFEKGYCEMIFPTIIDIPPFGKIPIYNKFVKQPTTYDWQETLVVWNSTSGQYETNHQGSGEYGLEHVGIGGTILGTVIRIIFGSLFGSLFGRITNTTDGLKFCSYNGTGSVATINSTTGQTIQSQLINGSLWFDQNGIARSYGQEIVVYNNGTISDPASKSLNTTGIEFAPFESDSSGKPKIHSLGEDIYISGSTTLLGNNTHVPIYVMPYSMPPADYSPDKANVGAIGTTDSWGNLQPTYLWRPYDPKYVGNYVIWIDRDSSGDYTQGDLTNYLTVQVHEGGVGGVMVPVDKFGLLAPYIAYASTAMIGAVATAVYVKRVKHRKEKQ